MLTHNKSLLICSHLFVPYCPSTSVLSVLVSLSSTCLATSGYKLLFFGASDSCVVKLCVGFMYVTP